MKLSRLKPRIEIDSLKSAVARNIFVLFILCTVAPLGAVGYISLDRASSRLESQALTRLRSLSKATGMLILERLIFLEAQLASMASRPGSIASNETMPDASATKDSRHSAFLRVFTIPVNGKGNAEETSSGFIRRLDAGALDHLNHGGTVLRVQRDASGKQRVFMARAVEPGDRLAQLLIIGEINADYLWRTGQVLSEDGGFVVAEADGTILNSTFPGELPWNGTIGISRSGTRPQGFEFASDGIDYVASRWTLFLRAQFALPDWTVVHIQERSSVLAPLDAFWLYLPRTLALVFCLVSFVSLRRISSMLRPIERLKKATLQIGKGNLDTHVRIDSRDEFRDLGDSFNQMAEGLKKHFETMVTINAIGKSLSLERDNDILLQRILAGAMHVTRADAGFVYIARDERTLSLELMHVGADRASFPESREWLAPLYDDEGVPRPRMLAGHAALSGRTLNIPDFRGCQIYDLSMNFLLGDAIGQKIGAAMAVPLKNHDGEVLGVLELASLARDGVGGCRPFRAEDERLLESLASQAAVAYAKNRMIVELKSLFESLIELIAKAIDEKSPYTGGHCRRVPIIAMMLADAVCATRDGALKNFSLSPEEMDELKVAALLHDCGKVTTPVHVVDKATKLETIFDRIELVDTRFEVLKRDVEIAHLRRNPAAPETEPPECTPQGEDLATELLRIEEDRRFLRECNVGREYMDPLNIERIRSIAARYGWTDPEGRRAPILSEEEIRNLSVTKGTLTEEDREIVNHHVVATINLLEALPYPKYLRNVPRYAGAHHERLDGKGYPKGLTADELDVQARIIAIADIFEALTAKDRPYKEGMMLSDSIALLRGMAKEGQIDPDIVDVLIEERVFLRYAEQYLDPSQIDDEYLLECTGLYPRD